VNQSLIETSCDSLPMCLVAWFDYWILLGIEYLSIDGSLGSLGLGWRVKSGHAKLFI
jgi:hypothetical protein